MPATNFDKRKVSPLDIDFSDMRIDGNRAGNGRFRQSSRVDPSIGASQSDISVRAEREQAYETAHAAEQKVSSFSHKYVDAL